MSRELRIETAKKTDYESVKALLLKTNLPPDDIELHMENFLVIRHPAPEAASDSIIGSVGLEIYRDAALLRSLAVDPDYQGRGLGSRLVDGIIEVAKVKGFKRLFLLTDTAEDFFKKRGFAVVTRDKVPDDMKQSIEFTTLCTSSPSMMREF